MLKPLQVLGLVLLSGGVLLLIFAYRNDSPWSLPLSGGALGLLGISLALRPLFQKYESEGKD